jgi:RNA polymerase sigma factor (sigma-70 family)
MESSVSLLVDRAVDGDEAAWGDLVDRYAPLVWAVCLRSGLTRSDAEDVVQAVWLRLLEHLPRLRVAEALPGWIVTTTRRECVQHARSAQARRSREAPLPVDPALQEGADGVDEGLLRAERYDALRAAFAQLDERCRRLLAVLMSDPPPSYAKVSADLAMPIGSIGPTRARCLDALRRIPPVASLLAADHQDRQEGALRDVERVER